jgi:hypothetical protein
MTVPISRPFEISTGKFENSNVKLRFSQIIRQLARKSNFFGKVCDCNTALNISTAYFHLLLLPFPSIHDY